MYIYIYIYLFIYNSVRYVVCLFLPFRLAQRYWASVVKKKIKKKEKRKK